MSYSVNGKVYTEHALMDEIVFNGKIILSNIVIKNDTLANYYETQESLDNATYYMMIQDGRMTFQLCPFTYDSLAAYGYSSDDITRYLFNRNLIPEDQRDDLVAFVSEYYYNHYEELNNYYRSLIGLPPYGTDEYNIYISPNDFPSIYDTSTVDFDLPIHEQPSSVISTLEGNGVIDRLINKYKYQFSYKYLRHLGDKKLDVYNIRRASKWEILYMPSVEQLVRDRFNELYYYNRKIYIDRYDQEAYEFNNEYYSAIMIINLISQTFADMIVDIPEWYIRRDIFDTRSVQYFLESYGVAYYKQIPLRYQTRIVKALNNLIKYKSSNKNNFDILDIFGMKGTKIYKYYLYKSQKPDGLGGYVIDDDPNNPEKAFDLQFIKTEIDGSYNDHIKDESYRYTYDEITLGDKYWDGDYFDADDKNQLHKDVKHQHLLKDFTIDPTKIMSLETNVSMEEMTFQLEYFVGMITDSRTNMNFPSDVKIMVPSINESEYFPLADLFTFLTALSFSYDDKDDFITLPIDVEEEKDQPFPTFKAQLIKGGQFIDAPYHEFVEYYSQSEVYAYFEEDLNYYDPDIYFDNPIENSITEDQLFDVGNNGKNRFWEIYGVIDQEQYRTWIEDKMFQLFNHQGEHHRVYGFNMEADLDELQEMIGYERHSEFNFKRGYTLEELGVTDFIPPKSISSIEELNTIYKTNKKIYEHLRDLLAYGYTKRSNDDPNLQFDKDFYEYEVVKFVFEYLFTKTFDYNRFMHDDQRLNKYEEILLYNTVGGTQTLYNFYQKINSEPNIDSRRDTIRNVISDVITTLEYYLSADGLDYIFSFSSTNSIDDILSYIILMINFFKSYKVSFLDPYVAYIVNNKDPITNGDYARDQYQTLEYVFGRWDKEKSTDVVYLDPLEYSWHYNYSELFKEVLDMMEFPQANQYEEYDYDGGTASTEPPNQREEKDYSYENEKDYNSTKIMFKMMDGGLANPDNCVPFKMIDAGDAMASGRMDLWDLDGGGAELIPDRDVFNVDGGYPFHPDGYIRRDYWVSHFVNDINAGYPTTRLFRTVTGIIRLVDKQRQGGSERMSQYMYNSMLEGEDGYEYSMDNIWLDWEENWKQMGPRTLKDYKDYIDRYCVLIGKNIELLDDEDLFKKWIEYCEDVYGKFDPEHPDCYIPDEPPYKIYHYADNDFYRDKLYQEAYDYMKSDPDHTITQYDIQHPVTTWNALDPNPITSWTIDDI